MNIRMALKFMPDIEKVCELEERRFFCNADETVNTISVYSMRKQIPVKPKIMEKPLKNEKFWWYCGSCGASRHTNVRSNYCSFCGQRVDWSEYLQSLEKEIPDEIMEHAKEIFPELDKAGEQNDRQ